MKNFWVVLLPLKILPRWLFAWAQPSRHQRLRRLLSPCPNFCPQTTANKIRAPSISLSRTWDSPVPSLMRPWRLAPKIRLTRLSSRPTAPIALTRSTLEMFSDPLPLGTIPLRFLRSGHLLKKNEHCFPNKLLRKMFYMTSYRTESEIEADWWSASKICWKIRNSILLWVVKVPWTLCLESKWKKGTLIWIKHIEVALNWLNPTSNHSHPRLYIPAKLEPWQEDRRGGSD